MSINARMSQNDPRLYQPNRDLAHNFDQVMMEVANRCEAGTWDVLTRMAKDAGVSDTDLGLACSAMCRFVAREPEKGETMPQCMAASGFLDCKEAARVVVSAYVGTVVLGIHWAGVREATLGGSGPVMTYQKLRAHGRACVKLMGMPRWRRRLYTLGRRLRLAWRAFWRKDEYGE